MKVREILLDSMPEFARWGIPVLRRCSEIADVVVETLLPPEKEKKEP
jgi:hypothetical protein